MLRPEPTKSRAILLGTSRFLDDGLPDIPAVANNLTDLAATLMSPTGIGLADEHCTTLHNESNLSLIGEALIVAAKQATELLLVYYSGHGVLGPMGRLHLSLPQTSGDRDRIPFTSLSAALLRSTLRQTRARNRILILDCCFAGQGLMSSPSLIVSGQLNIEGAFTLAAAAADYPAIARAGDRHTAFTGALITLLAEGSDVIDTEFLTLQDIYEHLAVVLPRDGFPKPTQQSSDSVARLALAHNQKHTPRASLDAVRGEQVKEIDDAVDADWRRRIEADIRQRIDAEWRQRVVLALADGGSTNVAPAATGLFVVIAQDRYRNDRAGNSQRTNEILDELSHQPILRSFEHTSGGDILGLIDDPAVVVDVALYLFTKHMQVAVGIGAVTLPLPESARAGGGPAYDAADPAVGRLQQAITVRGAGVVGEDAEVVLALLQNLISHRSSVGQEAVDQMLLGRSQSEVAEVLGISKQAVSQRLSTSGYSLEVRGRVTAERLLTEASRATPAGGPQSRRRHFEA